MTADSSKKAQDVDAEGAQRRKVWVTPTIEEADASEITAKDPALFETTYLKRGS